MDDFIDLFFSTGGAFFGILGVIAFFLFVGLLKSTIKVTNPDKILVITGRKTRREGKTFGFSVERGRSLVLPYFQSVGSLDLGVFPVNVRVEGVNSANGITVGADATACVCIDDDDPAMLYSAVERLMGKGSKQIYDQVRQTLVGNFRGALNKATPLQAIGMEDSGSDENDTDLGERAQFRADLLNDINSDLNSFGMKVVSVSLQKIWDTSNYIANLAQKTLAEKRQQVEIEEARLRAIANQSESDAQRRIEVSRSSADEAIIAARQELEVCRRETQGLIQEATLKADQTISEARNRGDSLIQNKMAELQTYRNSSNIILEAEAREKASYILAEGESESTRIREQARNDILKAKAELINKFGQNAASIMFVEQKLPGLFEAYDRSASGGTVDNLVVMNDAEGFSGAVNRGPRAFTDLLKTFGEAFGIDIKNLASPPTSSKGVK